LGVCLLLVILTPLGCGRETAFDFHMQTGLARLRGGEFEAAVVHLKKAAQRQPTSAAAYCNLGVAYWKHGDTSRAIDALSLASDLDGTDSRPQELLAHVFIDVDRYDDARRSLERAAKHAQNQARIMTHLALVEYEAGDASNSEALLKRALKEDPNYGPALYNLGVYSLVEAKDKPAAQSYFARYAASNRNGQRAGAALEQLRQLRQPPTRPSGADAPPPARVDASAARVVEPRSEPATDMPTADVEPEDEGDSDADSVADSDVRASDADIPADPPPPTVTVRESERPARSANSAKAHWKMAMRAHTYKDWPAAVLHYKKTMQVDPELKLVAYNLGLAYKEMGKAEEARRAFETELKLDPSMLKANYMMSVVLREMKETGPAISAAQRTLKLDPKYAKAHFMLGLLYWENGDFGSSRTHFQHASKYANDVASRNRAEAWLKNLEQ
ncbi:MAG: tetratricopeptide (TPR) repeat protein, partial [Kiritimatiellia bacterium]